ncbi:MAG: hypothetical protein V3T05_10770 [Myxococcota bacterium]
MVSLIDLENPESTYSGRIFWDMLRPGVRLQICGPRGCVTSVLRRVVQMDGGRYYLVTRNSRYLLTKGREASVKEIQDLPTIITDQ